MPVWLSIVRVCPIQKLYLLVLYETLHTLSRKIHLNFCPKKVKEFFQKEQAETKRNFSLAFWKIRGILKHK